METSHMNSTSQNDDIQSSCLQPRIAFHLPLQWMRDIIAISVLTDIQLTNQFRLIPIRRPAGPFEESLVEEPMSTHCRDRRRINHHSMNGKTFGIHCIPQKFFS